MGFFKKKKKGTDQPTPKKGGSSKQNVGDANEQDHQKEEGETAKQQIKKKSTNKIIPEETLQNKEAQQDHEQDQKQEQLIGAGEEKVEEQQQQNQENNYEEQQQENQENNYEEQQQQNQENNYEEQQQQQQQQQQLTASQEEEVMHTFLHNFGVNLKEQKELKRDDLGNENDPGLHLMKYVLFGADVNNTITPNQFKERMENGFLNQLESQEKLLEFVFDFLSSAGEKENGIDLEKLHEKFNLTNIDITEKDSEQEVLKQKDAFVTRYKSNSKVLECCINLV